MRDTHGAVPDCVAGDTAELPAERSDDGMDLRARNLFSALPAAVRPHETKARYPHVLNQIAADWEVPRRFLALMDNLLLNTKGGRQGFVFGTVVELISLRSYYVDEVHPELSRPAGRYDPGIWR